VVYIAITGGRGETLFRNSVGDDGEGGGVPKHRVGVQGIVLIHAQPRNKTLSCIGQHTETRVPDRAAPG